MKNVHCPICLQLANPRNPKFILERDGYKFEVMECKLCLHHFTFFDQEVPISSYYDENDYQIRDTRKSIFNQIQELEYQPIINYLKKKNPNKTINLLDFGAGKGLFLNLAKKHNLEVKGVETSSPRAAYSRNVFGLTIDSSYYTEGKIFKHSFEAITIFHVLEHLEKPFELLNNLVDQNLAPEGLLIIEVPNFKSWQSKWAGKHWLHLDVPRHLSHFSPLTITNQLEKFGFFILKTDHFSWHLGIIGMIQSIWSLFGYRGFLIGELKERKRFSLLFKIGITLPLAIILESSASLVGRGGIMRFYTQKKIT
jgi:2-polyprenyl-3-methyl-5-hydroxy-6-metoxy-1,4-benzoquinol methylase